MLKIVYSISLFFLLLSSCFADSLPSFPMTIYGTITGAGISTKISFYDGNNSLLSTYLTTREWWYGYDSTISGTSPIFSGFTGTLRRSVEYQNKTYTISSITGSTIGCPVSNSITFVSTVCRYDIVTVAPIVTSSSSSSVGGGSSSYTAPLPIAPVVSSTWITQSGTVITLVKDNGNKIVNETTAKDPITITPQELRRSKVTTLVTIFKKGTILDIYRVLPNWRNIKTWNTRVLPNGKIRFTMKTSGKYIFVSK